MLKILCLQHIKNLILIKSKINENQNFIVAFFGYGDGVARSI
jgi:hypothetical protein